MEFLSNFRMSGPPNKNFLATFLDCCRRNVWTLEMRYFIHDCWFVLGKKTK